MKIGCTLAKLTKMVSKMELVETFMAHARLHKIGENPDSFDDACKTLAYVHRAFFSHFRIKHSLRKLGIVFCRVLGISMWRPVAERVCDPPPQQH